MVRRSRTPQGVRGLKHFDAELMRFITRSHSARSAWIETQDSPVLHREESVALRKECVD